jgi:putative endonuclease
MPPTSRRKLGDVAERLAAQHLVSKGYEIRETNHRTRFGEIDIIAEKADTLAFVEVRCRRGNSMGSAAESLSASKQQRLLNLAEAYGAGDESLPDGRRVDLIAIDLTADGRLLSLEHIEGAIWAE